MRIKDGCEISISGRNKRRILLVVVILSIIALLTPVSLAATAGRSDIEITDQSVNTDKITAPLLNPAPSALILSILNKEDTVDQGKITDQSVNTDKNEPTVAENNDKEPVKDTSPNKTPEGLPNNAKNRFISVINELFFINETELNIDSCYKHNFTIPDDLEVGDILIWDAGYSYSSGFFSLIPPRFSGHCAIYTGGLSKKGNCVEALPKGVGYNTINGSNYYGEHFFAVGRVKDATPEQKKAAAKWAIALAESKPSAPKYQNFWEPGIGAAKWFDSNGSKKTDKLWYCSELVWAAYFATSLNGVMRQGGVKPRLQTGREEVYDMTGAIDIDKDGWNHSKFFPFIQCSVSPLEIFEDDDVDIFYDSRYPNGTDTNFVSLSVDSGSNSNSNTLIYSDSEEGAALNYLNSGSNSNILTNPSSSLNTNTLTSNLLNLD